MMRYYYLFLCLSLSLRSVLATDREFQAAEKVVNAAGQEAERGVAEDIIEQNKGHYPRLARQGSLGQLQHAWDKAGKGAGAYNVTYSQGEIIRLRLREFTTTAIKLPSWEKIEDFHVSDRSGFDASMATEHILYVQPKRAIGIDSNVIVIGNSGLVYNFLVRSEGYNSENTTDLTVNVHVPGEVPQGFADPLRGASYRGESGSWRSSKDALLSRDSSSPSDVYPQEIPFRKSKLNWNWAMSGDEEDQEIAPMKVFSDGIRTWFDFADRFDEQDLPVVYRVIDGVDTQINTRIEDKMIVAETVGVFSLRNGKRVVCVYPSNLKKS